MMQAANVQTHPGGCTNDDVNEYCNDCPGDCDDCPWWYDPHEYYPEFTDEKQLKIIKLMIEGKSNFTAFRDFSGKYHFCYGYEAGRNMDFSQALAQLTARLINTKELDKQNIKEILER